MCAVNEEDELSAKDKDHDAEVEGKDGIPTTVASATATTSITINNNIRHVDCYYTVGGSIPHTLNYYCS